MLLASYTTNKVRNFLPKATTVKVDWEELRKEIANTLVQPGWDDGNLGPVFIRLAWHASGTYDK